jgi:hypothetical protein
VHIRLRLEGPPPTPSALAQSVLGDAGQHRQVAGMVGGQLFDAGVGVRADELVLAVRGVTPADHRRVVVERVDHLGAERRVAVEEGERPRHRHVVPQSLRPVSSLLDRDVVPQP